MLTTAIRRDLDVDAVLINGATIKGNRRYASATLTYADLKQELPFPTKMVVVDLPGCVLECAIRYSRQCGASPSVGPIPTPIPGAGGVGGDDGVQGGVEYERRGFLQTDQNCHFDDNTGRLMRVAGEPFEADRSYTVALPRNLLAGFCEIEPLVEWAKSQPPLDPEAFTPALISVLSFFSKKIWAGLGTFDEIDADGSEYITATEIAAAIERSTGQKPTPMLVSRMIAALDTDGDSRVTRQEFHANTLQSHARKARVYGLKRRRSRLKR